MTSLMQRMMDMDKCVQLNDIEVRCKDGRLVGCWPGRGFDIQGRNGKEEVEEERREVREGEGEEEEGKVVAKEVEEEEEEEERLLGEQQGGQNNLLRMTGEELFNLDRRADIWNEWGRHSPGKELIEIAGSGQNGA